MKKKQIVSLLALAVAVAVAAGVWAWLLRPIPVEVLISLKELPGVTPEVLGAQGSLFRIEEPFLYNRKTKMAVFVAEILSGKNFGEETHLTFGGDSISLQCFASEIRMVNSGPNRVTGAGAGVADGVESLVSGLWQLLRHPIDTISGLGGATISLAKYVKDTPLAQVQADASNLADAFYMNRACEVAEGHSVDYFELKTDSGRAAVHTETNFRLGGQAVLEVATFLVPFSKLKYGGEAAEVGEAVSAASKGSEAGRAAEVLAEAGDVSAEAGRFAKAGRLFPRMWGKMGDTLTRLKYAAKPARFTPPVAKLGKASSMDYRATFFARYPQLEGKVVVHHAVEKQALQEYPGLFASEEIHSLENLRGIPKERNAPLHLSRIRREWNEFYRANPAGTATKQKFLDKATELDRRFGLQFEPKLF
jgi:hypothetical protein